MVWSRELRLVAGSLLLVLACAMAGIKPLGFSADLDNYRGIFEWSVQAGWGELLGAADPLYHALTKLAVLAGSDFTGFTLLLAVLTCLLKAKVICSIETDRAALLLLYAAYLFWLHDYTQIRLGLALAFVLLAVYAYPGARWPLYLLAAFTHASCTLLVVLHESYRRPRAAVTLLVALSVALIASGHLETLFSFVAARVTVYLDLLEVGEFTELNIFSSMPAVQAGILIALWPRASSLSRAAREEYVLSCLGVLAFYGASFLPVLAFRLNELLMPYFLILISRTWRQSPAVAVGGLLYVLSGLRTTFFSSGSLVFSGGG